jgi:hypothetical protein
VSIYCRDSSVLFEVGFISKQEERLTKHEMKLTKTNMIAQYKESITDLEKHKYKEYSSFKYLFEESPPIYRVVRHCWQSTNIPWRPTDKYHVSALSGLATYVWVPSESSIIEVTSDKTYVDGVESSLYSSKLLRHYTLPASVFRGVISEKTVYLWDVLLWEGQPSSSLFAYPVRRNSLADITQSIEAGSLTEGLRYMMALKDGQQFPSLSRGGVEPISPYTFTPNTLDLDVIETLGSLSPDESFFESSGIGRFGAWYAYDPDSSIKKSWGSGVAPVTPHVCVID